MKISLILADTLRSKEYLNIFSKTIFAYIKFYYILIKNIPEKFIIANGIKVSFLSKSINNIKIFDEIRKTLSKYFFIVDI